MTDFSGSKNDKLEQMVWRAAKAEGLYLVAVAAPLAAQTVFVTVPQDLPESLREHITDLAKLDGFEARFTALD